MVVNSPRKSSRDTSIWTIKTLILIGFPILVFVVVISDLEQANSLFNYATDQWDDVFTLPSQLPSWTVQDKATIAYAVSITGLANKDGQTPPSKIRTMMDGAAVLHQSIRLASKKSKYDYHMIAFIHPDAMDCVSPMQKLGYEVQVRDTPFNLTEVQNPQLIGAQKNGCCGEKEYLKLYSYVQFDFPIVVHLDLDTMVLKPMDDIFDLMLDPSFNRSRIESMWLKPEEFPPRVDFLFTRDYNMVDPPRRQPHQIGVQGGFLVVRPNQDDFNRYVQTILQGGNWVSGVGWGGKKLRYGGYYGAGTIQGLASYYYGELQRNRSVELNRCNYNTMVDDPYNTPAVEGDKSNKTTLMCRTLEPDLACEDCTKTNLSDIYTAHFTICAKPQLCPNGADWARGRLRKQTHLCMELHREWHLVRRSLEEEWTSRYPPYNPQYKQVNVTNDRTRYIDNAQGHCYGRRYAFMEFPSWFSENHTSLETWWK